MMAERVNQTEKATFAGGCFWCMEPPFQNLEGVISVTSGYMGGQKENPTYEEVCSGTTGHAEVVQIVYDPLRISYEALLEVFWRNIDPTAVNRQFVDQGSQYRTAVFYHNQQQQRQAEQTKAELEASGRFIRPLVTEIVPASDFYPAEEYHQNYHHKEPLRYDTYRWHSGRDQFLKRVWEEKE